VILEFVGVWTDYFAKFFWENCRTEWTIVEKL
jgi:hypothetical protein